MSDYKKDESGVLERLAESIIEKKFPDLKNLKFLFVWRKKEKFSKENQIILAQVNRVSSKHRDLFGYDIMVEFDKKSFPKDKVERRKLMFHELKHIEVKTNDDGTIKFDSEGRIQYNLLPHDICLMRFEEEIAKFGFSADEEATLKRLNKLYKKFKGNKE